METRLQALLEVLDAKASESPEELARQMGPERVPIPLAQVPKGRCVVSEEGGGRLSYQGLSSECFE